MSVVTGVQGLDVVQDYDNYYEEAYYAWSPYYPLAERDLRFYIGDQWDEKEKQSLFEQGRNQYVFNYVRRNINLIDGYQRKNQLSSVVIPVENSDQYTADLRTKLLLYVLEQADGYHKISDSFSGALKTGLNLATLWMDYRDDPVNGDLKIGREPYSGVIMDPYFTSLDWSDCAYVIRRKYLNPEHAASLLPGMEEEVYDLHKMGWSRDDKFTWLPYQRQPNGQDLIAYNEFYQQKWKKVSMLVDTETGEYAEWQGNQSTLKQFTKLYPQLKIVQRSTRYIEKHIILNDRYMKTDINPYGMNEYPFVPFVAIWEPESDLWGLKLQSLIRCMIDPQKESNRRRSQMSDILDSQINSGWIADEDSVVNPRSLFQSSQGKVIWKKRDSSPDSLTKIPPAQIPPSMFQLQELYDKDMMQIAGINDAAFGETSNPQESGVMFMLRQGASVTSLQGIFDNLRYSQKMLSKKILRMIQSWTPEKIERITNMKPTEAFYDPDSVKYDVVVQEGTLTNTQKQMYFHQLVELQKLGVPVTGKMLSEAAPIQGKTDYNNQIAEQEKQQAQEAKEQADLQKQILQTQSEMAQAKSISDIALSKERFTRSIANLGLQEERNSEAIQNRAQAALDRTRAMKELDGIDDDRLVKYLGIVRMMEEMNKAEEEKNKADDLAITEQSEKLNSAFPNPVSMPNSPDLMGSTTGTQPNQPLEV